MLDDNLKEYQSDPTETCQKNVAYQKVRGANQHPGTCLSSDQTIIEAFWRNIKLIWVYFRRTIGQKFVNNRRKSEMSVNIRANQTAIRVMSAPKHCFIDDTKFILFQFLNRKILER